MPTINKTDMAANGYLAEIAKSTFRLFSSLPNVETEKVSDEEYKIYFDGRKDYHFRVGTIAGGSGISIWKSDGSAEICHATQTYVETRARWLREYICVSDNSCRLISTSDGDVGTNTSDGPICALTANDVNGNTVYGIGIGGINHLVCLETEKHVDISGMANTNSMVIPDTLADKALLVKATNLCSDDLPEIKEVYTAMARPLLKTNGRLIAAERYYISGAVWGCVGSKSLTGKCPIFDPMIKI